MTRIATIERATAETTVRVRVDLDGTGERRVATGIGFFDHLLDQLAKHGMLDLEVEVSGDLAVDEHHTVEDTGIALGRALDEALGDRSGIGRFGDARVPLDEALADCVIDLGGRAFSRIDPRPDPLTGTNPWLELVPHFLESVAREARMTLHLEVRGALSAHHHTEAAMKAFARALRRAVEADPRAAGVPSTKGTLR
jgi:imidazoleglycerol-phosphate dehydratase